VVAMSAAGCVVAGASSMRVCCHTLGTGTVSRIAVVPLS
jgi:hypothetical protein